MFHTQLATLQTYCALTLSSKLSSRPALYLSGRAARPASCRGLTAWGQQASGVGGVGSHLRGSPQLTRRAPRLRSRCTGRWPGIALGASRSPSAHLGAHSRSRLGLPARRSRGELAPLPIGLPAEQVAARQLVSLRHLRLPRGSIRGGFGGKKRVHCRGKTTMVVVGGRGAPRCTRRSPPPRVPREDSIAATSRHADAERHSAPPFARVLSAPSLAFLLPQLLLSLVLSFRSSRFAWNERKLTITGSTSTTL
ncbi:hypothetical protein OH77DRAFT_1322076 [Trametes cingulata]|nr:hypothetical protein OH77DRAFT_1322076 [Trametes cingulata]